MTAAELSPNTERCPKGHTVPEECFAPFRYCPEKGCGRAEGGMRLPTDDEPLPPSPDRKDMIRNLLTMALVRAEASPDHQPLDVERWSTPHRHYNREAMTCEHGDPLNIGWLEMGQEMENAQQILDIAGVPDGLGQGPGDLDWRVAEMYLDLHDAQTALSDIAAWHARETAGGGMVGDYCVECEKQWPCPTYRRVHGLGPDDDDEQRP